MGQREIIDYLKTKPNCWVSQDELMDITGVSIYSIRSAVRKLIQAGEITRRFDVVDNPDKPGHKRYVVWIKINDDYMHYLVKEGLL